MSNFSTFLQTIKREELPDVLKLFKEKYSRKRRGGWTGLHWACWYNCTSEIASFLIDEGAEVEAETNRHFGFGQRPIHMAARNNHIDTLRLLISKGCDLEARNKMGETALDVLVKWRNVDAAVVIRAAMLINIRDLQPSELWSPLNKIETPAAGALVHLQKDLELIRSRNLFNMVDVERQTTVLDSLVEKGNPKVMEAIKAKPLEDQEINDWLSLDKTGLLKSSLQLLQECFLYRSIRHNHQTGFSSTCSPAVVNGASLFRGPTALETATEFQRTLCVKDILLKLIYIDESWDRAENIAKKRKLPTISKLLHERRMHLGREEKRDYGRLHIAVRDNEPEVVDYILRHRLLDPNQGNKTVGTALSLACEMNSPMCIRLFQKYKVNCNTVDKWKQSPLQIAIKKRVEDHCEYLVDNVDDVGAVDQAGLTLLQGAVLSQCERITDRLLKKGASVNDYLKMDESQSHDLSMTATNPKATALRLTDQETIHSLCIKVNGTLWPCLLRTINLSTVDLTDGNKNTLLHLAAVSLLPEVCSKLILVKGNVNSLNARNNSPLMELLEQTRGQALYLVEGPLCKTAKVLVEAGSALDITDAAGRDVLQSATEFHNEEMLLAVIRSREMIQRVNKPLLETWFRKKYFRLINKTIHFLSVTLLEECITKEVLEDVLEGSDSSLAKVLYKRADQKVKVAAVEIFLCKAARIKDIKWFKELLSDPQSPSGFLEQGESLLGWLIKENMKDLCKVVVSSQNAVVFLDKKNGTQQLPMHLCVKHQCWEIMEAVIAKTSSVYLADDDGNTPLSLLLERLSRTQKKSEKEELVRWAKMLISRSADVNRKDRHGTPAIMKCTDEVLREDIRKYFLHKINPRDEVAVDEYSEIDDLGATLPICSKCLKERRDCALNCGHLFCTTCSMSAVNCFSCGEPVTDRRKLHL